MEILYLACLSIIAIFSIAGILSRYFDDNLSQRIGLSFIGIASTIEVWMTVQIYLCYQLEYIRQIFIFGAFIYAMGTIKKVYKFRHHNA